MNRLLIVVDMQNDFITGSLANPAAQAIVEPMVEFISKFDGDVCFTQDTHKADYFDTQEGKYLPVVHCLLGTEGWKVESSLVEAAHNRSKGMSWMIQKPTFGYLGWSEERAWLMDEDGNTIHEKYDEIILVGTCTDICVISNALILKATYPEATVKVVADLCAGLTSEKHEAALEVMKSCQVEVI